MVITSVENEKVKKFKKLQKKKYRDQYNQYIIEGEHLIFEAFPLKYTYATQKNVYLQDFVQA